jgi:lipid II isoglutaminyl synthase (glutamine-hydrolysing)
VKIRVGHLYPDYLNIYADRGNIAVFARRASLRGHELEVTALSVGDQVRVGELDLLYIGGGQDREQALIAPDLAEKGPAIEEAVDAGAALLAVCGGYQLLGHRYQLGDRSITGLGIADLETVREPGPRLIGNVSIEVDIGEGRRVLAGFENHGGRTHLGPSAKPLGRVLHGHGNNGSDGYEGVRRHSMIGTYLHGPLLPKNAWLADRLIALAIERRTGSLPQLEPLGDELEAASHASALRAAERD